MFVFLFGKRKCGTRDEVRVVFPKRSHSSRAWDDYEVAFVFTTYFSVCVVFDDDHLRKRTHTIVFRLFIRFPLYWFSVYRVIKALVSLIII